MIANRPKKRPVAEINIVPYVDVMLVLLVIFMVTAPMLSQGVQVDLPTASSEAIETSELQALIVSVDKHGLLYLNLHEQPEIALSDEQLLLRLHAEYRLHPQRPVLLKGDKACHYDQIMQAMRLLKLAHFNKIGLMTQDVGAS